MSEENPKDKLHTLAAKGEDRPHAYSCPNSPNFSVQLSGGTVVAEKGVLRLTDRENEELEALIAKGRPDLTQNLVPLRMAKAEAIARADIVRRNQAQRGGANTMNSTEGQTRGENVKEVVVNIPPGASEAQAQKMAADGNQLKAAAETGEKPKSLAERMAEKQK